MRLIFLLVLFPAFFAIPIFDPTALLQNILIPADAAVNSIIYRLRAYDPTIEYPLTFTLSSSTPTTVAIETLNCTRLNSICQANVILRRKLEAHRIYDFIVIVTNLRGESTRMNCSFQATNATTPISDIFPGAPTLLMVAENARRNTELGRIIAKGNPKKSEGVVMELWGGSQFGLHQKLINSRDAQATIVLLGSLDYEKKTVHHLTILANDPWSILEEDTRNIASWPLLVAVIDIQDTPPIFTLAPPTTTLSPALVPGDVILRVHAEDGDRGKPRSIRYGLVPEHNPFTTFFNMSEETGELRLVQPLSAIQAISHSNQPILLTVIAEEVRTNSEEPPAQSSTISLALIPPGLRPGSPIFASNEYRTILDENAPIGTTLELPQAEIVAQPGDVITLSLIGNNDTFEIVPTIIEGHSKFAVKVHNPKLLDYEKWHSVNCMIVAKEVGVGNYSTSARLEVLLNDINDNPPEFTQKEYQGSVIEGAKIGTTVLRVEATDIDREPHKIKYTKLYGTGSDLFNLNPETGILTVNSINLDAEEVQKYHFFVEANDGLTSTATITVNIIDVNDEIPKFDKNLYEFIISTDKSTFTSKAIINAIDKDVTSPNNDVHYELIKPINGLHLNSDTGELVLTEKWSTNQIIITRARAYDGGIPRLSSECEIRIYPPDQSRRMVFIVPGKNPNLEILRKKLSVLTGGKVQIEEIRPYYGDEPGAKDYSSGSINKSVVVAVVTYSDDVIDVNTVRQVFDEEEIKKAGKSGGNLLWLLILLLILALLLILTLILCCICQGCPLYVPPKRRKIIVSEEKLIVPPKQSESKSVQVAEWFGRKEAWTPDNEIESLRRHELERGSDRSEVRRVPKREQLYIREGNADILRLVTRGNDNLLADSGKDIIMQRFIDQSENSNLPNAVAKLQTEHELLEASLRQQNALLRQILIEREKDLRLETQSLPAGTQTDQDRETQTEDFLFRRKVRSDNDASENSEDEIERIQAKRRRRVNIRRLKTPIQEESEIEEKPKISIKQTRTSELRQKKAKNIKKEVLREISASLEYSSMSEEEYQEKKIYFSDSLEDLTSKQKYYSESDLRKASPISRRKQVKSSSQNDLKVKTKRQPKKKSAARYMEWYNKSTTKTTSSKDTDGEKPPIKEDKLIKETVKKVSGRLMQDKKKDESKKKGPGPEHPLLQHSEHRFEVQYPIGKKHEQDDRDNDSGIALARLPIAQKKSVFTIAYDDMHTSQLRPDSHSPPL